VVRLSGHTASKYKEILLKFNNPALSHSSFCQNTEIAQPAVSLNSTAADSSTVHHSSDNEHNTQKQTLKIIYGKQANAQRASATKMYDLQLARLDEPIEILYHQDGKNIVRKATQQLNVHNTCTR